VKETLTEIGPELLGVMGFYASSNSVLDLSEVKPRDVLMGLIHPFGVGLGADGEQSWSSSRSSTSLGNDGASSRR
jgi:hypothetical protein